MTTTTGGSSDEGSDCRSACAIRRLPRRANRRHEPRLRGRAAFADPPAGFGSISALMAAPDVSDSSRGRPTNRPADPLCWRPSSPAGAVGRGRMPHRPSPHVRVAALGRSRDCRAPRALWRRARSLGLAACSAEPECDSLSENTRNRGVGTLSQFPPQRKRANSAIRSLRGAVVRRRVARLGATLGSGAQEKGERYAIRAALQEAP